MNIEVEHVAFSIHDKRLIDGICLQVKAGEMVGLIGPNGSGKSTLLKNMYRVLKPDSGLVTLDGRDMLRMKYKETARQMAVVSQDTPQAFDFSVRDIVLMGRHPHKKLLEADTAVDHELVEQALERVGMDTQADQGFATLSGGEKQRVLIARALAGQAKFLILDEPTNHLDIRYQLQILDLVKALQVTTLAALHDLNLAAFYCDRIYVLKEGKVVASGITEDMLQPNLLRSVFGVETEICIHPKTGKPSITFLPNSLRRGDNL
ncbi:cobalmin/iron-siderophore ABC transporter ATPase [Paenibacillus terrae HPL-003]|uniref:Cobalmin/iron-siderophore ABC transporter ATPase n=1 Tax=Paenibacillus terrae (strain HPL-003) TaxID=985665 RepID=G7W2Y4_PAETH|nr:ABC transporter ATP-binding protein [Paenibacillus terrae]AET60640.1 cobalmin/iron-siderophore ABC transporter ATPase [Paenibacillus terrae HPL-003]